MFDSGSVNEQSLYESLKLLLCKQRCKLIQAKFTQEEISR